MVKSYNTTTGLILGLATSLTNLQYTSCSNVFDIDASNAIILNSQNSNWSTNKTRIEDYVDSKYEFNSTDIKYNSLEGAFFDIVQSFADKQYLLEKYFYDEMDKLLLSKIGNSPTKKRVW